MTKYHFSNLEMIVLSNHYLPAAPLSPSDGREAFEEENEKPNATMKMAFMLTDQYVGAGRKLTEKTRKLGLLTLVATENRR